MEASAGHSNPMVLAPIVSLGVGAFLVYFVARVITRRNSVLAAATAVICGLSLGSVVQLWGEVNSDLSGLPGRYPVWGLQTYPVCGVLQAPVLQAEPGALLMAGVALSLGLVVAIYSGRYSRPARSEGSEEPAALDHRRTVSPRYGGSARADCYYPLLLCLLAGMTGMVMTVDLFALYLFTVLASAAAYVLVAFRRSTSDPEGSAAAIEAGFKYVIMGGLGAILILTGIGYIYREMGTLSLPLRTYQSDKAWGLSDPAGLSWSKLGMAFVIAGYGIKSALVPAHTWLPDAHGRAPSSISALLSGILIETNLYVLVKVGLGIGWPARQLGWLLIVLSIMNMMVGNLLGLVQEYGKRLLGYSSIAQVGYIMMALGLGLAYDRPEALSAGLFLIVAHAIMKGLAFLCIGSQTYRSEATFYCEASRPEGSDVIDDLRGMGRRVPVTAGCFILALAGLAGIPPLAGFMGKWQVLASALGLVSPRQNPLGSAGVDFSDPAGLLVWLATAVFVLSTLLSLGYYLRLIGLILNQDCDRRPDRSERSADSDPAGLPDLTEKRAQTVPVCDVSSWMLVPMIALATLVILVGVFPQPVFDLTNEAARFLLKWGH